MCRDLTNSTKPSVIPLVIGVTLVALTVGALTALTLRQTKVEEPVAKVLDRTDVLIGLLVTAIVLAMVMVIQNALR